VSSTEIDFDKKDQWLEGMERKIRKKFGDKDETGSPKKAR